MKILMCHDGSSETDRALGFGVLVAKAFKAEVTLLGISESSGAAPDLLPAGLQRTREQLESEGLRVELVFGSGPPVPKILGHGEKGNYDLVIIGAGLPRAKVPAKTYELITEIGPPVLLVVGQRRELKRILVCTGGRESIQNAIRQAGEIAVATGATVTLLHVFAQPPLIYSDLIAREEDVESLLNSSSELGRNLRSQKDGLEKMGARVEVRIRHGFVADEIVDEAEGSNCDLIVTGSSADRGALHRYMLGDVTHEVVNRAPCPVLIARPAPSSERKHVLHRLIAKIFGRTRQTR